MTVRKPVVAGSFYSVDERSLQTQIEECFLSSLGPGKTPQLNPKGARKIIGVVSPHAGYMYSGPVAASGFYQLAQDGLPELVVILGPNHAGLGADIAVSFVDSWETPLGRIAVDIEVCRKITNGIDSVRQDELAHSQEHSIEVQLPFLQYIYGSDFHIVPICVLNQSLEACTSLGEVIAHSVSNREAILVASTDFTHYEPQDQASGKDKQAIDAILSLEASKLANVVQELNISMCGVGPVMAMLAAARKLGGKQAELISYHTSGDVTGDRLSVVGYGSIKASK